MRLALVQFDVLRDQRSHNLAVARRMVQRAAERVPAPDLIVLPGLCDTGTDPSGVRMITRAMCEGFAQSVATLAREWGVWICCGHAMMRDKRGGAVVTLFDPDGDTFVRSPRLSPVDVGQAVTCVRTPLGVIVAAPAAMVQASDQAVFSNVNLTIAAASAVSGEAAVLRRARAGQYGDYLCVSSPSGGPTGSSVLNRAGKTLARVAAGQVAIAHADLPITHDAAVAVAQSEPKEH